MPELESPRLSLYEQLLQRDRRRKIRRRVLGSSMAAILAIVVVGAGVLALAAWNINSSITRSDALNASRDGAKLTKDTNILVIGLDSRVDEQGKPLSSEIYSALNAGDEGTGGYNANVLMLVHIPADGTASTALSIPRDNYVDIAGIPGEEFKAKIKEAYGYGMDAAMNRLFAEGKPQNDETYQTARESGRMAQIATITQFLGSVHIDHFVEVSMAAFYETAEAIAPITVCVNRDTQDTYSGANFVAGEQKINGKQSMAFVRQRRDTADPSYAFSDLDRQRRQQAFIASVIHQLGQAGTFTDIKKMQSVISSVSKNIVIDSELNLIELAQQASSITSGNITFTTLPIAGFGISPNGASINTVDLLDVQATVEQLLSEPTSGLDLSPHEVPNGTESSAAESSNEKADLGNAQEPSSEREPVSAPSASEIYADWTGPLRGGAIPCVK